MDGQDFYRNCLAQATAIVKQVQAGQLSNQTPDDEWTVRDLANHMLYEVSWVPDMVGGKTMAEVGTKYDSELFDGDVANAQTNLIAAWDTAAAQADEAARLCDPDETAHLSYTDTTNSQYLSMTGGDILVHAWDLSRGIGVPMTFDPEIAASMWSSIKDRDFSGSGLFKPKVSIDDTASDQDKILAHMGRNPQWQPEA